MKNYIEKFSSRKSNLSDKVLQENKQSSERRLKLIDHFSFGLIFLAFFLTFFDEYDNVKFIIMLVGLVFLLVLIYDFRDSLTIFLNEVKPEKFKPKTQHRLKRYFRKFHKVYSKMSMLERVRILIENGISVTVSMIPVFNWEIVSFQSIVLLFPLVMNFIIYEILSWRRNDEQADFFLKTILLFTSIFQVLVNIGLVAFEICKGNSIGTCCFFVVCICTVFLYRRYNKRWRKRVS